MSKRLPIFLGMLLVFFACWLLITDVHFVRFFIERLEDIGYDIQLRTKVLTQTAAPQNPIAIIDVDDKSLKAEGRWPWPRDKIAQLVDTLQQQGAAVIAFDMIFSETSSNIADTLLTRLQQSKQIAPGFAQLISSNKALFDEDAIFAKSLKNTRAILAIGFLPRFEEQNQLASPALSLTPQQEQQLYIYKARGFIGAIPILQQASAGDGFINIFSDSDGIYRHAPLIITYQKGVYPSLALQAVMTFLNQPIELVTPRYNKTIALEGVKLGNYTIPTDAKGEVLIPFIGKSYTFSYYSATDVLHNKLPPNAVFGKILFVGTSGTGLGDLVSTAIQNPFPGVEVQATIANGLLDQHFSFKPAWTLGATLFFTFFLGMLAAVIFPYLGPRSLAVVIVFVPTIILFINNWIWSMTGLVLSFIVPVILILIIALLNMLYGYLFETRKREQLKEIFGQYVPERHIDEMLKTTGSYGMRGEDREMSVLFADIRNFTTISEGMTASELVEMLNTLFTPMTEAIFKHRGTIDKYVGDLIMAFWGAPLKDRNHARHAIQSALDMQTRIKAMQPELRTRNWPEIKMGIGINSGVMSVGDMGSRFRRNYTVLGDAVNLASRVEGLTKFYGVDIVVTEQTEHDQAHFVFRKLDRVAVKGKKQGVEIYEVLGTQANLTPELKSELNTYHQALDDYFNQRWDAAYDLMHELHVSHPNVYIYKLYVDRIVEFKTHPVPADWDGIYKHVTK